MSDEPDAERCEACAKMKISVTHNRWGQEVGGEDTSIEEHHAEIARLLAQVAELRGRAAMAEGVAKVKNEEVEELRFERDTARNAFAQARKERDGIRSELDDLVRALEAL